MTDQEQTAAALKRRLKAEEAQHGEPSRIRIHRAISWLKRSESEHDDPDARCIFLWIAFNAAYAQEFGFEQTERETFNRFLVQLLAIDEDRTLQRLIFDRYSGPVRVLIDNPYVFDAFWRALREHDASGSWEQRFKASQRAALHSVMSRDAMGALTVVFDRLYVLRNQLVHGGATWNGRVNRRQVRDGAALLGELVPLILRLMIEHPGTEFGEIAFPVVGA